MTSHSATTATTIAAIGLVVVIALVVVAAVVRSCSKKRINEMPAVQMPLLTSMTMTPNPDPGFPLTTDETDPSSTVVLGVWVSMLCVYGCLGGRTSEWTHGCISFNGCTWCTSILVIRVLVVWRSVYVYYVWVGVHVSDLSSLRFMFDKRSRAYHI